MVYIVTYDLNKNGQRYEDLYALLRTYDYIRDPGLDSVWFISTSKSLSQFSDHIRTVIDGNDRLFVSRINRFEYDGWMNEDIWKWINSRV